MDWKDEILLLNYQKSKPRETQDTHIYIYI